MIEIQAVSISSRNKSLQILNVYNPNKHITIEEFNYYFSQLSSPFIITGDFNAHHEMWDTRTRSNPCGRNLVESLKNFPDICLLTPRNLPTYHHQHTNAYSTLDLTFVSSNLFPMSSVQLAEDMGSDHEPIWTRIAYSPELIQGRRLPRWKFESGRWDDWIKKLPQLSNKVELDDKVNTFQNSLMETSKSIFKLTKETITVKYSKPWWNDNCAQAIQDKHKSRNLFRKHPTEQNFSDYKSKESIALKIIKESKINSFRNFCSEISYSTPIKKVWNHISALSKKFKPSNPTVFYLNSMVITDSVTKCGMLADKYENLFKCKDRQKRNCRYLLPITMGLVDDSSEPYNLPITVAELDLSLSTLKMSSPGEDLIHNNMLKLMPKDYKFYLLDIFNHSFDMGKFPKQWKSSIILPILKDGKSRTETDSYRPISLLPCCGKLMEKIIFNRLNFHIERKNKLRPSQGGFRKRLCTIDQISVIENEIRNSLVSKKITIVLFVDLHKAFDSAWHLGILFKLYKMGIKGRMLKWVRNYLSDRKFKVFFEGKYSPEKRIGWGFLKVEFSHLYFLMY